MEDLRARAVGYINMHMVIMRKAKKVETRQAARKLVEMSHVRGRKEKLYIPTEVEETREEKVISTFPVQVQ